MFLFMCSIFAVGFFFSLLLMVRGGAIIFWMYVLATILGLFYTKGPINYAYRGVSEPIVLFFLGSLAVFFTAYLQTLKFDLNLLVIGLAPGFFSVALLAINNLRDYEEDCLTKKNTLVVRFGKVFGKIEVTLSILLPFIILWSSVNLLLTPFLIVIIYQLWTSRNIPRLLPKVAACFILFNVTFIIKTVFGC